MKIKWLSGLDIPGLSYVVMCAEHYVNTKVAVGKETKSVPVYVFYRGIRVPYEIALQCLDILLTGASEVPVLYDQNQVTGTDPLLN